MDANLKLPSLSPPDHQSITEDAQVVLKLLLQIQHLVSQGIEVDTSKRLCAAAKLYLDTRDAFQVVEKHTKVHMGGKPKLQRQIGRADPFQRDLAKGPTIKDLLTSEADTTVRSEGVINQVENLFQELGDTLAQSIRDELQQRHLAMSSVLYYVRFMPVSHQWTAYKDARQVQVDRALELDSLSPEYSRWKLPNVKTLLMQGQSIKEHLQQDIDNLCVFTSEGSISTIFGDTAQSDQPSVGDRFESLVVDVYSKHISVTATNIIDSTVTTAKGWEEREQLGQASDQDLLDHPIAQCYFRRRKFRSKMDLFPDTMGGLPLQPFEFDKQLTMRSLVLQSGEHILHEETSDIDLLVADPHIIGVWWEKHVVSRTDTDICVSHTDPAHNIDKRQESLDGQIYVPILFHHLNDVLRRFGRNGISPSIRNYVGERMLVNFKGKDTRWLEVFVDKVEDKRCFLVPCPWLERSYRSLNHYQSIGLNRWVSIRSLRYYPAPANPHYRLYQGKQLQDMLHILASNVDEMTSVLPDRNLTLRANIALWKSLDEPLDKVRHLYARYLRSALHTASIYSRPKQLKEPKTGHTRQRSFSSLSIRSATSNARYAFQSIRELNASYRAPSQKNVAERTYVYPGSENDMPEEGYFLEDGTFGKWTVDSGASSSERLSPWTFDKLAHHILEEVELLGSSLDTPNQTIASAFVQVLDEYVALLVDKSTIELNVFGKPHANLSIRSIQSAFAVYTSISRLLFVWHNFCERIHIHQVQASASKTSNQSTDLHIAWTKLATMRIQDELSKLVSMLETKLHQKIFRECTSNILPAIREQCWTANQAWLSNGRCTYAIQFLLYRLQGTIDFVLIKVHPSLHESSASWTFAAKAMRLIASTSVQVFSCLENVYVSLKVSTTRLQQWKIDIIYFVCGARRLIQSLQKFFLHHDHNRYTDINQLRRICLRLIGHLALRCVDQTILDGISAKEVNLSLSNEVIASLLDLHITSICEKLEVPLGVLDSDEASDESLEPPWNRCSVFSQMEMKSIASIELNWRAILLQCGLSKDDMDVYRSVFNVNKPNEEGKKDTSEDPQRHHDPIQSVQDEESSS